MPRKKCDHGHLFTPENTYVAPDGERGCRKCRRAAVRRYQRRKKLERIRAAMPKPPRVLCACGREFAPGHIDRHRPRCLPYLLEQAGQPMPTPAEIADAITLHMPETAR